MYKKTANLYGVKIEDWIHVIECLIDRFNFVYSVWNKTSGMYDIQAHNGSEEPLSTVVIQEFDKDSYNLDNIDFTVDEGGY